VAALEEPLLQHAALGEPAAVALLAGDRVGHLGPAQELLGRPAVVGPVEVHQQGGAGERGGADVEGEAHQRVELPLRERDGDHAVDGGLGLGQVGAQQGVGPRLGEVREGLAGADAVAVADGGEAGGVVVGGEVAALAGLDQREPLGADLHGGGDHGWLRDRNSTARPKQPMTMLTAAEIPAMKPTSLARRCWMVEMSWRRPATSWVTLSFMTSTASTTFSMAFSSLLMSLAKF